LTANLPLIPDQCGSEPARDGGATFNKVVDCRTAIASKLAPTEGISAA